jgi:hypothetical protein
MTAGTGIENKAYRSRPAEREDIDAVVHLYNLVTGKQRRVAEHRWEWWETPAGPGSMWVIEETASGAIVGHHGLIPTPLLVGGQHILAGKTENTMVHPDHRDKVLYFLFERQFVQEAAARFDLLFTTSGYGAPGRIRRKLGYQSVGATTFFLKVTRGAGLQRLALPVTAGFTGSPALNRLAALVVKGASRPAALAFAKRGRPASGITVARLAQLEEILAPTAALWQRTGPVFGITIERSAPYLRWRLGANPNVQYVYFAAWRGRELVGFAAVEPVSDDQALIVDIFVEDNRLDIFDTLIGGLLRELDAEGVSTFVFPALAGDNGLAQGLRRNGFYDLGRILQQLYRRARRAQPELLVKVLRPELAAQGLYTPGQWYYSALFTEGLRTETLALRKPKRDEAA